MAPFASTAVRIVAALCCATLLPACAVAAEPAPAPVPPPAAVKVFEPGMLRPDDYVVIRRIWTDSFRSAFRVPTFPDAPAAMLAMQREAARAGADGIMNMMCLSDAGPIPGRPSLSCHGELIKLTKTAAPRVP